MILIGYDNDWESRGFELEDGYNNATNDRETKTKLIFQWPNLLRGIEGMDYIRGRGHHLILPHGDRSIEYLAVSNQLSVIRRMTDF